MALVSSIIRSVISELSQVPGTGVQLYAEGRILNYIQAAFDLVFEKVWWEDYMEWNLFTLDGVSGLPTTNPTTIARFTDIRSCFWSTTTYRLRRCPEDLNIYSVTGTTGRYIEPTATTGKVFQIWPNAAAGTVRIHSRARPADLTTSTDIKLDRLLMVYGAAWMAAQSDGSNPGEIDRLGRAFNKRFEDVRASRSEIPSDLDYRTGQVPTTWTEIND